VHQVGFSFYDYIEMHGQQNIKFINISDTVLMLTVFMFQVSQA
jgi:hypothetical protein